MFEVIRELQSDIKLFNKLTFEIIQKNYQCKVQVQKYKRYKL